MPLPRPPISPNTPIPNQPFSADEAHYLEGSQGQSPSGNDQHIDLAIGELTDVEPEPQPLVITEPVTVETVQFPQNPEPNQEFTDLATNKKYRWQRARLENGWFKADDPATPEDEAWTWQWLPLSNNPDTDEAK
jgi:hypothetical protein